MLLAIYGASFFFFSFLVCDLRTHSLLSGLLLSQFWLCDNVAEACKLGVLLMLIAKDAASIFLMRLKQNSFYSIRKWKQFILSVIVSREARKDTHLLIQLVVIGCNRPFTTVNLVRTLCVLRVCVCFLSRPLFSLKPNWSGSRKIVQNCRHHDLVCFPSCVCVFLDLRVVLGLLL